MRKKSKRFCSRIVGMTLMFLLAGCGAVEEENPLVIVENETEEIVYSLAVATIGDVICTDSIRCTYLQVNDQEISFPVAGKMVSAVYVEKGDEVVKGQLLAELTNTGLEEEIRRLEYTIARNELLYEQSVADEANDLERRRISYEYYTRQYAEDGEAYRSDVENITRSYRYTREDYQDAIYTDTLRLEELKAEAEQGRVYAEMDGTVSFVKQNLEGSLTIKDETVMKVIDGTECVFASDSVEYAQYFTEETQAEFLIVTSGGVINCYLKPFQMDTWGEKLYFAMTDDGNGINIDVGSAGTMKVITGQKSQVLRIPGSAVHVADGKTYVYVVGEDNMREVKWVETGLYGDSYVEIVSGLTEGEKVILK